jgi:hypothetical protein
VLHSGVRGTGYYLDDKPVVKFKSTKGKRTPHMRGATKRKQPAAKSAGKSELDESEWSKLCIDYILLFALLHPLLEIAVTTFPRHMLELVGIDDACKAPATNS